MRWGAGEVAWLHSGPGIIRSPHHSPGCDNDVWPVPDIHRADPVSACECCKSLAAIDFPLEVSHSEDLWQGARKHLAKCKRECNIRSCDSGWARSQEVGVSTFTLYVSKPIWINKVACKQVYIKNHHFFPCFLESCPHSNRVPDVLLERCSCYWYTEWGVSTNGGVWASVTPCCTYIQICRPIPGCRWRRAKRYACGTSSLSAFCLH